MGISSGSTRFIALTILAAAAWGCDSDPNAPSSPTPPISSSVAATALDVSDGHGKAWRQLTPTTGISWTQAAQVCPRDGATPCNGLAGGRDLTGWVWATAAQVNTLLSQYEDDVLASPSVSGPQYFFTADVFFQSFVPTFSFSGYTSTATYGAGWTSSTDAGGTPIFGSVGNGHNGVSIGGHFSSANVAQPDSITADRGVFLWRPDGSGAPPQSLVLSRTTLTMKEGTGAQFTVRLAQQPAANVVVSVAFLKGTATVAPAPTSITFTPANWSVAVAVKFKAPQDADKYNNAATIALSSAGIAPAQVAATITDDDRPAAHPMALVTAPLNGQTVSGVVYPSGTGTDSNGQVVEARFYVDGVLIFTDRRIGTTFPMTGGWNTATVSNGWHTLQFRAIDNGGNEGRMMINIFVSN